MTALCPHCGFDLIQDTPINCGDMRFDPRGDIIWKGKSLRLKPALRIILGSLLKAPGRFLSREMLADRLQYEGANPANNVSVLLWQLKQVAPDLPIERAWKLGARWVA